MKLLYRTIFATLFLTAAIACGTPTAQAQTRRVLTLDMAKQIAAAAVAEARRLNSAGVIAIVDDGGNLMYVERLDNTFVAGANISIGKARTAAMFRRPTRVFEEIIRNGRTPMITLPDFTPLQGGVPIELDGQMIGGIGVSGAASQQQDEEIAIAGANAVRSLQTNAPSATPAPAAAPVTYFPNQDVAAAFASGAVLVNGDNNRNYMVHASRRERPGMAEVHTRDTDIIYVLDGAATFVTGGTVVDGRTTEPDEIRGASIRGGNTRRITRGDVIIVPHGTPHWFQEVQGPLTYYVVKVR